MKILSGTKMTQQRRKIILHLSAWALIILISIVFFDRTTPFNNPAKVNWRNDLLIWMIYVLLFYLNYTVLMPKLLFRRKTVAYVLFSFVALAITYGLLKANQHIIRTNNYREYIRNSTRFDKFTESGRGKMFEPEFKKHDYFDVRNLDPFTRRNLPLLYSVLLVFSASMVIRFTNKWKEEQQQRVNAEKEKAVAELEYLKQQINPHFLFNALNSIYSLTISHSPAASDSVLRLSSILRYMLYETDKENVPLSDEVAVIEGYIALQKLRLTPKTTVTFELTGDAVAGYRIEPLLLIPFIENAFKYGVDSIEDSFIRIRLKLENESLCFSVQNRVVGKTTTDERNSGIGIKNIRRRLELLYPDRFDLETKEKDGIFYVSLTLKLRRTKDKES